MSKTQKITIIAVIVAVLMTAVGYAAIANITLNIAGTAEADPSQENFKISFSGTPIVSDENKVNAAVTNDLNATLNVSGLTAKGDVVTAKYTIQNILAGVNAAHLRNYTIFV